jgi:hypothetical protein
MGKYSCSGGKDVLTETNALRTFNGKFDDFFITSIDNETPSGKDFWAICLNFVPLTVGGCQQKVKKDDQVLFAYATENVTKHYLKLSGPALAILDHPVTLKVTDGTGAPIQNATVDGQHTDAKGEVSITFNKLGIRKLKAEKKPDSVRSNQLVIDVIIEGAS